MALELGVTPHRVRVALVLRHLSLNGETVDGAARIVGREASTVKSYARDFGIELADFQPRAALKLTMGV